MTAKRFIIMDNLPKGTHSNIWDKQKQHNQGIGDELWLGEVVAMLNEGVILAEENEQLKIDLGIAEDNHKLDKEIIDDIHNEFQKVKKENEQLKQFKNEVFNLINAKIKLYSHKPVSAPISQPMSVNFDADMDRLARLSELKALKEELQE